VKSLFTKQDGSALALVLSVLIILSTLMMLYFGVVHFTNKILSRERNYYHASLNAKSAINHAQTLPKLNELFDFNAFNINDLKFTISRYQIGFSEHIVGSSTVGSESVHRIATLATHYPLLDGTALISSGLSFYNPLYVTGNTEIHGNVITGKYKVSANSIKNIYYRGKRAVYGEVKTVSQPAMPEIDLSALNKIVTAQTNEFADYNSATRDLNFKAYTFKDTEYKDVKGPGTVFLAELPDTSNFEFVNIISSKALYLNSKTLRLKSSMVYSENEITIKGEYRNCQFISRGKITVEPLAKLENCLIMVLESERHIKLAKERILLKKSAIFSGQIVYVPAKGYNYREKFIPIKLDNSSELHGVIYSPYGIDPNFILNGSLLVNYFEFTQRGTKIQNFINGLHLKAEDRLETFHIFKSTKAERFIQFSQEL
jgi:hypothetical protein